MKQTIKVQMDQNRKWQPSKYVNRDTPIVLDRDRFGVPLTTGTATIRVRQERPNAAGRVL